VTFAALERRFAQSELPEVRIVVTAATRARHATVARAASQLSVLLGRIVRRKKSGKDHNRVERHKKNNPTRDGALPFQVPASVRIRGSAQ